MAAKLYFGMMLSLDGYIAGPEGGPGLPTPDEALHRHFNQLQQRAVLSLCGRKLYEIMTYWDDVSEDATRPAVELEFAQAWRATPKVVISTTLTEVGPNARLVGDDVASTVRAIKAEMEGEILVGGAALASSLSELDLIDEFHLYFYPVVLGGGTPFFPVGKALQLAPLGSERLPQDVMLVRYAAAVAAETRRSGDGAH